ncbi:precorrin-3B C(17)-methyltransferase [Amycolatopsis sp. MtRt-6]|uniref:precorrin-3B C(17)-methyltransferase n=1 Tax=Amycolatopsis sp. MtRt-6 TaxID=2792782 RepID=UPI001A8C8E5F|nr:precorrin-3B C(17)-methyltransferase [Amycolatopsis sp. MtRt-6]
MTGELALVGLGPGGPEHRTPAAATAVREADVVVGYEYYLKLCADITTPDQELVAGRMGEEAERADVAVRRASAGARVALVSTGDIGVYGMASLALQLTAGLPAGKRPAVRILPGVTAAVAAAALLGAPLARDFACLTLSDVLAPWELVERRLRALAGSGVVLALYNVRSAARPWQLGRAREVLLESRPGSTPVGVVTNAARDGEQAAVTTLGELSADGIGMNTVLIVGAASTSLHDGWMVTDRALRGETR